MKHHQAGGEPLAPPVVSAPQAQDDSLPSCVVAPECSSPPKMSGLTVQQGDSAAADIPPDVDAAATEERVFPFRNSRFTVRPPEKALRWGGRFKKGIFGYNGNIDQYTNEYLGMHGLKEAFDGSNGWGRTWLYITVWVALGAFFLFLTIPLVQAYQNRSTITSSKTIVAREGLPLPVITVCPHGRGIECSCLLWRKLHCRYRFAIRNLEYMSRFDQYSCWNNFDFEELIAGQYPRWIDPKCEDFTSPNATDSVMEDPCAKEGVTTDKLFDRIVSREKRKDGPYLTQDELLAYGASSLAERVTFYRNQGIFLQAIQTEFIIKDYVEPSRGTKCVQLRIPPTELENRQQFPGADYGIVVVATGLNEENYGLGEMDRASAALDVGVNPIKNELYNRTVLYIESRQYQAIAAGATTTLEYRLERVIRRPGWGSRESRLCQDVPFPRSTCVQAHLLRQSAVECGCSGIGNAPPTFLDCSATIGTQEHSCVYTFLRGAGSNISEVPLSRCPYQCDSLGGSIRKQTVVPLSNAQILFLKNIQLVNKPTNLPGGDSPSNKPFENATIATTFMLSVGLSHLEVSELEEIPEVPLGSLLGQVGGNAGLWCGMSFSLIVEIFEFGIMALLYGDYSAKRQGKRTAKKLRRGKREAPAIQASNTKKSMNDHDSDSC